MRREKGITLIALVITIVILIILAGVAINLTLGDNGIFNKAKLAKEKYNEESIREKVELGIMELEIDELTLGNQITIESALQELLEKGTFETIDKDVAIGNIGEYEVKLKYNEQGKVVIEYIEKAIGVRVTYKLNPESYTNGEKVSILLTVNGKVKSVTKPDNLIIYPENNTVAINYQVTVNGTYKFIIEDEEGNKQEKNVVVDTIDRLPPNDFTITAENTGDGIKITANTTDAESDGVSVKSGIDRYEYYAKKSSATVYIKYTEAQIYNLNYGTYSVYAIAYDKAGNKKQSNEINCNVRARYNEIYTGGSTTYAIDTNGDLWAWGNNEYGQLLDGSSKNRYIDEKIETEIKFKYLSTNGATVVAIDEEGNLWSWGKNNYGQLGDGTTIDKREIIKLDLEQKFSKVSVGHGHVLAIDLEGNLWTWGDNSFGQLGDGTTKSKQKPIKLDLEQKFFKIAINSNCSYAIDEEGNLWSWGYNGYGQLGDGTTIDKLEPTKLELETKVEDIETNNNHVLAIDEEGNVWSWGYNNYGQLGDGTTIDKSEPTKVELDINIKEIGCGAAHTVVLDENGDLWSCGYNRYGELGLGDKVDRNELTKINVNVKFSKIFIKSKQNYAIDTNGGLWVFGYSYNGELITKGYILSPKKIR